MAYSPKFYFCWDDMLHILRDKRDEKRGETSTSFRDKRKSAFDETRQLEVSSRLVGNARSDVEGLSTFDVVLVAQQFNLILEHTILKIKTTIPYL